VVPLHLLDYLQATLPRLGVTKAKVFAHYFSRLVFSGFSSDLVHCVVHSTRLHCTRLVLSIHVLRLAVLELFVIYCEVILVRVYLRISI